MTMTLFYSPGACSLASHIALEESGLAYQGQPTQLAKGEHKAPDFLAMNPRGKVPTLKLDDGKVLTENVAILTYVARSAPDAGLLPQGGVDEALCLSLLAYLSNTVHPAFTHIMRPERFVGDEAMLEAVKAKGRDNFEGFLREIDGLAAGSDWLVGPAFSVADAYAMVFYAWGKRIGLPVDEMKAYSALKDRVLERPAARRVLEREGSILVA